MRGGGEGFSFWPAGLYFAVLFHSPLKVMCGWRQSLGVGVPFLGWKRFASSTFTFSADQQA